MLKSNYLKAVTVTALLCQAYFQGFFFGSTFISSFNVHKDCDAGLCPVSYISTLLFTLTTMLSFFAGDRLGSVYGVKRTYEIGLLWSIPCILLLESGIAKELTSVYVCLNVASIGGTIAIVNGLSLLDAHIPSPASSLLAGGATLLGANSGGRFAFHLSDLDRGQLFLSVMMSILTLYILKRYVPEDKPILYKKRTDYFGVIAGAIGLILLALPARFLDKNSLANLQNIAILGALLLYWCLYAFIESKKTPKDALVPAMLWDEIILCSALILGTTYTVLQSMFQTNMA